MIDTTYQSFAQEAEYIEMNRRFVRSVLAHAGTLHRVVDLACGTGMLADLLFAELEPRRAAELHVVGVDLSRESLSLAEAHFATRGRLGSPEVLAAGGREPGRATFVRAPGDSMPLPDAFADALLIGNAIHCFTEPVRLLTEVRRVLLPGGVFAFNTTFYAGSLAPGTEQFYEEWMKQAVRHVMTRERELRQQGLAGELRRRGQRPPAFSNRWLTPQEYTGLLEEQGFTVLVVAERTVEMTRSNFERIGAYAEMATVLLSGYPVELACEALGAAAGPAFEAVGLDAVPRVTLEVVGVRR